MNGEWQLTALETELLKLANLYCEEQLDDGQFDRLQTLLRSDRALRSLYLDFMRLHGQLVWDTGRLPAQAAAVAAECESIGVDEPYVASGVTAAVVADREDRLPIVVPTSDVVRSRRQVSRRLRIRRNVQSFVVASCAFTVMVVVLLKLLIQDPASQFASNGTVGDGRNATIVQPETAIAGESSVTDSGDEDVMLPEDPGSDDPLVAQSSGDPQTTIPARPDISDAAVVAEIDRLLRTAWSDNHVIQAEPAGDHEWVRRLYLTTTGRIPTIDEVTAFVDSADQGKRERLIRQLNEDPRTAENMASIWTNLLIGRSNSRGVDQEALYEFLRDQFAGNHSWMETVGELIAAEGRSDQNGATNFLLAHLNDQATPATAVTARLFLGQQVQCTQCHDHPFATGRTQHEFWSLNAFFKQTIRQTIQVASAETPGGLVMSLTDAKTGGMTFYETLKGQQKAVLPEFAGQIIEKDSAQPRRAELARLLEADEQHQVARSMVNRMWAHYFGYGFTNPVDDMGSHNPPSHPELLEHLTRSFVDSGYDLRRLMSWIAASRAYQLSGRTSEEAIAADDPEEGGIPLFSRAYPRPLGPEQVYESIRTAIRSAARQPIDSSIGSAHRRQWVDQFVESYGTDENDEQLAFEGNISQAMLLMNGDDLEIAIPAAIDATLKPERAEPPSAAEVLQRLSMATLNRMPTETEEKAFWARVHALARSEGADAALKTASEDMLWAYLNSSEFVSLN